LYSLLCKYAAQKLIEQNFFKKTTMTIQHKLTASGGNFFLHEDDEVVGELTYATTHDNQMIIEHTRINEEYQGGDLGYELVHKAIDFARTHGYMVVPICQFAKAVIEKKPEFKDVSG
jgi:predicted GNAT family acetyltransferase